jgi:hypothetical protein
VVLNLNEKPLEFYYGGTDVTFQSALPPGHWANPGVVVTAGKVYAEVSGSLVALEQHTGKPVWSHPLGRGVYVRSLVATRDHLVVCTSVPPASRPAVWEPSREDAVTLLALNLNDGKVVWQEALDRSGNLAPAGGMVYLANGDLRAYGPAERTFRLAIDSDRRTDFLLKPQAEETAEAQPCAPAAPKPPAKPADANAPPPLKVEGPFADAAVVRLTWGTPLPQMVETLRARYQAAPGLPVLLSLDRLDSTRTTWRGASPHKPFSPEWTRDYAALCARLAQASRRSSRCCRRSTSTWRATRTRPAR